MLIKAIVVNVVHQFAYNVENHHTMWNNHAGNTLSNKRSYWKVKLLRLNQQQKKEEKHHGYGKL